jgi:nucleoside-diphosphate-sugar epimerase
LLAALLPPAGRAGQDEVEPIRDAGPMNESPIPVTAGLGFIGSALTRPLVRADRAVVVSDNLKYAGNLDSLQDVVALENFAFGIAWPCRPKVVSAKDRGAPRLRYLEHAAASLPAFEPPLRSSE